MKKGPLSKKEKSYITKNRKNMTTSAIASRINRSVSMVDKYVANLEPVASKAEEVEEVLQVAKETPEPKPEPKAEPNPLYARNVTENGVVRSTIGTQAASMAADESRSKRKQSNNLSQSYRKQHIHEIKPRD